MADSSGEEFYSAPESEEDTEQEQLTLDTLSLTRESLTTSKVETGITDEGSKVSDSIEVVEGPKATAKGQGNSGSTKNRGSTVTEQQQPDNSSFSGDLQPGAEARGQEFMKGVDNRLVSDDHGVLEGDKVELSEEQIKVGCELVYLLIQYTQQGFIPDFGLGGESRLMLQGNSNVGFWGTSRNFFGM